MKILINAEGKCFDSGKSFGIGDLFRVLTVVDLFETAGVHVICDDSVKAALQLIETEQGIKKYIFEKPSEVKLSIGFENEIPINCEVDRFLYLKDILCESPSGLFKSDTEKLEFKLINFLDPIFIRKSKEQNNILLNLQSGDSINCFYGTHSSWGIKQIPSYLESNIVAQLQNKYQVGVHYKINLEDIVKVVLQSKLVISIVNTVPHICRLLRTHCLVLSGPTRFSTEWDSAEYIRFQYPEKKCEYRPCNNPMGIDCSGCMQYINTNAISNNIAQFERAQQI
jgi:hypothetical protein